jgi:phospholipid/cholesterol/gamma-HCH transport system substrate-binding protein
LKFSKEIKVGLLVTSAVIGLFYGMNYLKGVDVFSGVETYYALYQRVDGLAPSNDVLMNGLKVGQVEKIEFTNDRTGNVLVTLQVRKGTYISQKSTARIISSDLLGGRAVEIVIVPGNPPAMVGDTLSSDVQTTFSDQMMPVKDRAEQLMASLDTLANSLNMVFSPKNRKSLDSVFINLDNTLDNVESATASLDQLLSPSDGKLRRMIENVESISGNIKSHNNDLTNIIENLSSLSDTLAAANISNTLQNADSAITDFSFVLQKIKNGEGTIGALATNDSLYQSLQKSADEVNELLTDIKNNPHRYLHFSVFGRKEKKNKGK